MSSHSHNEQVKPTPFEAPQAQAPTADVPAGQTPVRSGPAAWVLPALGGLLLLAVLVIFWLPERVNAPAPDQSAAGETAPAPAESTTAQAPTAPAAKPAPATSDVSPWSDAQLAKLRKEAQDALAELLDIQFALEEQGVKQWAPERFAAVAASAAAGDELYRAREYLKAKEHYQEGLAALQALQASIPQELARQLEAATAAIENGDPELAAAALDLAQLIAPNNPDLATLRQRNEVLPQLLALLDQAATAEQTGDLQSAEQLLRQATAVDPQHQRAQGELQRVAAAYQELRFNEAMSEGYAALDAGRFKEAREAFRAAGQLQTGSSEAASALQEVETAATAHRLATLKTSGARHEQGEQWQQAVTAYEQALKIDPNVLYAREGLARSSARARLDKQFRNAIDEPQRLADVAVAEATEQMLQQARKIQSPGPVLSGQISRLQVLLQQASTPIAVTLRSDLETEVIVYKVARLGRFDTHELTLRPGTYTAVGSRNGYRDVRRSFTIGHDTPPAPITIACTEPI
jgi:tetratricopeptide (TPR) repeat protein